MGQHYTTTWDGDVAVPSTNPLARMAAYAFGPAAEALPYTLGWGMVKDIARDIAASITSDARTLEGPVVWITGNSYMPPLRSISAAERVWNAANNDDGELWAAFVQEVENRLDDAKVYLSQPDYDNALYAVDLRRWQWKEEVMEGTGDGYSEDLNDEWERIEG